MTYFNSICVDFYYIFYYIKNWLCNFINFVSIIFATGINSFDVTAKSPLDAYIIQSEHSDVEVYLFVNYFKYLFVFKMLDYNIIWDIFKSIFRYEEEFTEDKTYQHIH